MVTATRIGMLTPSSNTCLEPVTYRMLAGTEGVTAHFSRLPVTRISLDSADSEQFAAEPMLAAARLLADARVDVIMWNGTSGSWLGPRRDHSLAETVRATTGVSTSTSTLALLEACRAAGVRRLGLATPYTDAVAQRIVAQYATEGIEVVSEQHLGITDNEAFGRVSTDEIADLVRAAAAAGTDLDAVAVVCTNVHGAEAADALEHELGLPILDSVVVTLWHALRLAGLAIRIDGFGALLAGTLAPASRR